MPFTGHLRMDQSLGTIETMPSLDLCALAFGGQFWTPPTRHQVALAMPRLQ